MRPPHPERPPHSPDPAPLPPPGAAAALSGPARRRYGKPRVPSIWGRHRTCGSPRAATPACRPRLPSVQGSLALTARRAAAAAAPARRHFGEASHS